MSELILTDRWTVFRPHKIQRQFWDCEARFILLACGRRSGKTELVKRKMVLHLYYDKPGSYFLCCAPTYGQAKLIWWEDLIKLIPKDWVKDINRSSLTITTHWESKIRVVGLEAIDRIEGVPCHGIAIDEFANLSDPLTWTAHVSPMLTETKGFAYLLGVPDSISKFQIEYERLYLYAMSGIDPEWRAFTWKSAEIMDPVEVEKQRDTLDQVTFEQEYEGKFHQAGGRAFKNFSSENIREIAYNPNMFICGSWDFNFNPNCSLLIQYNKNEINVLHEFCLSDTVTDTAVQTFIEYCGNNGIKMDGINVYGDPSGTQKRSESTWSNWQIIYNNLRAYNFVNKVAASHSLINDTINAVRAKVKNANGEINLRIHPSCKRLINDMQSAIWPSDDNCEDQHCLAALRYFTIVQFPIKSNMNYDNAKPIFLKQPMFANHR
jgi:hypothetical protein